MASTETDPRERNSTYLAVGAFVFALVTVIFAVARDGVHLLPPLQSLALVGLAFVASKIEFAGLPTDRGGYTPASATVVAAALVGGPLTGVPAGLAGAHRRRSWLADLFWGSVAVTEGCAAGSVGLLRINTAGRVVLALAAAEAVTFVALVGVHRVRKFPPSQRFLKFQAGLVVVELVVVSPLLVLIVERYATSPLLATLGICSLLGVVWVAQRSRGRYLGEISAERERARRDGMTGLLNRGAFEEVIEHEYARFDRFHWINHTYDYAGRDLILRELSQRLDRELRDSDLVGRWGGEELIVLAPDLDPSALGVLAEKPRRIVRDAPVEVGERQVRVTCSVGGAMLDPGCSVAVSLQRANRALKRAKETRDCACVDSISEARRDSGLETQIDALTGLLNRQALTRLVLPREIERVLHTKEPLALLLIDLDNFKGLNDLYGHVVGDQIITGVGDTIATVVGRDDLVFRIGGDEFAVVLPVAPEEARRTAETILAAVERRAFVSQQKMPSAIARVSLTIGITSLDEPDRPSELSDATLIAQAMLTAADQALMAVKRAGRGCVGVALTASVSAAT